MTFQLKFLAGALVALPAALWAAETNAVASAGTNEAAAAEAAVDPKFERYKTILDRMPFGSEPVNFNPDDPAGTGAGGPGGVAGGPGGAAAEAEQTVDQQQIISSVRISALNVTPSGKVAVGFTDNSKQPVASYYLKVGETRDDWTVKEADASEMTVVLEKGGVSATLKLGEGSDAKGGRKGASAARGAPAGRGLLAARRAASSDPASADAAPGQPPPDAGGSPLARLRANQRRMAEARQAEAERKKEAAAQAKAEREAERAQVQEEREQQRQALLQIQEELKQQREARQREQEEKKTEEGGGAPTE